MKNVSIVIPTYNEKDYLLNLLESINKINYSLSKYEVIVVSDGSTDGTPDVIKDSYPSVKVIDLDNNVGRYQARKIGANAAIFDNILFVDSRSSVDQNILKVINQTNYKAINGVVESGNPKNPFQVFFQTIRRKVYPAFYNHPSNTIEINQNNFDTLPKGTTVFFVQKDILFLSYDDLSGENMGKLSSDDTKLIQRIIYHTPVLLHPGVKITHFIRKSFKSNFLHLIYRGSTFIDYYLDPSNRHFWLVVILPIVAFIILLALMVFWAEPWFYKLSFIVILDFIIAGFLAINLSEFITITYMLPVCGLSFYLGVIRGIFIKLFPAQGNQ